MGSCEKLSEDETGFATEVHQLTEHLAQTSSDLRKWKITLELSTLFSRSPDLYTTSGLYESQYLQLFTSEGIFTSRLRIYSSCIHWKKRLWILNKSKSSLASNEPTNMWLLKSLLAVKNAAVWPRVLASKRSSSCFTTRPWHIVYIMQTCKTTLVIHKHRVTQY